MVKAFVLKTGIAFLKRLNQAKQKVITRKEGGSSTSILGLTLQLLGSGALLYGVYMIYPPAAFIIAGSSVLMIGERI